MPTRADDDLEHDNRDKETDAGCTGAADDNTTEPPVVGTGTRSPQQRWTATASALIVVALAAVTGWLGWQAWTARHTARLDAAFVQTARQAAVNLTTIDWQHADADVTRITDSATGAFYQEFSDRSQPFIEVVKKAQSKSEGTVTAAGLENVSGDTAQVLVAVSVTTSTAAAPDPQLRAWRLRISVTKVNDNDLQVGNVEFVA